MYEILGAATLNYYRLRAQREEIRLRRNAATCTETEDFGEECWQIARLGYQAPRPLCPACVERERLHREYRAFGPRLRVAGCKVSREARKLLKEENPQCLILSAP